MVPGHGPPHDADTALAIAEDDLVYLEAVLDYARSGGDPDRPDAVPFPSRGGFDDATEHAANVRRACAAAR